MLRAMTPEFIGPRFPDFYAESAYYTGARDADAGRSDGRQCFVKHGEVEPVGMRWYLAGQKAARG